jgi:outer membrane protein TolC
MRWPAIFIFFVLSCVSQSHAQINEGGPRFLTWAECLTEAQKNHPDLISARESVNQSVAVKDIRKSNFFPKVDGDIRFVTSKSSSTSRGEDYSYGASGSQLIFDGFKTFSQIKEAQKNITAEEYRYLVTSSDIRLRLRDAFIELLREQHLVKISEDIAQRRKASLDLVTLRYEGGREHKGALLTAQANLARAEADVSQTKRSLALAQRRLTKEMGWDHFASVEVKGDFIVLNLDQQEPDFEQLAETTPFLKELIARKESAKYGIGSARADFFPSIFASGDIGRSESNWPPRDESWSGGVSVSLPLFDGGSRGATLRQARSALTQAKADERSGRDGVMLTLHEAWVNLQNALDDELVQKKFLESTEARAKISEAQYSNGLVTFDDWIIIEDALVKSQTDYLQAQANALRTEANWIQAKGGTLEYEN